MKLFLFSHGGSENHGREAIVRSTTGLFGDENNILYSLHPKEDYQYGLDKICAIVNNKEIDRNYFSLRFVVAYLALKVCNNYMPLNYYLEYCILSQAKKTSAALSIGGDNYCYNGFKRYTRYRKYLQKHGVKTVLWGCSVEPALIDAKMRKDLSRYNLITARESITYEALRKINSNVVLAPDPAFTLQKQPGIFPDGLGKKPYIGMNVSPQIQGLERGGNITMENYRTLVAYILETTDRDIALIPHVVWEHNDDRIPLGQLYEEFKDTGRVFMVEDQNCMQLKDISSG